MSTTETRETEIVWTQDERATYGGLYHTGHGCAAAEVTKWSPSSLWWWEVVGDFDGPPDLRVVIAAADGHETREAAQAEAEAVLRRVDGWREGETP